MCCASAHSSFAALPVLERIQRRVRGAADEVEAALAQLLIGLGHRVEQLERGIEARLEAAKLHRGDRRESRKARSGRGWRRAGSLRLHSRRLHRFFPDLQVVARWPARTRRACCTPGRRRSCPGARRRRRPCSRRDLARDAIDDLARRGGRRDIAVPRHGAEARDSPARRPSARWAAAARACRRRRRAPSAGRCRRAECSSLRLPK